MEESKESKTQKHQEGDNKDGNRGGRPRGGRPDRGGRGGRGQRGARGQRGGPRGGRGGRGGQGGQRRQEWNKDSYYYKWNYGAWPPKFDKVDITLDAVLEQPLEKSERLQEPDQKKFEALNKKLDDKVEELRNQIRQANQKKKDISKPPKVDKAPESAEQKVRSDNWK